MSFWKNCLKLFCCSFKKYPRKGRLHSSEFITDIRGEETADDIKKINEEAFKESYEWGMKWRNGEIHYDGEPLEVGCDEDIAIMIRCIDGKMESFPPTKIIHREGCSCYKYEKESEREPEYGNDSGSQLP